MSRNSQPIDQTGNLALGSLGLLLLAACNGCHGSTQPASVGNASALGGSPVPSVSSSSQATATPAVAAPATPAPTVFHPPATPGKRPVTKAEDCPKDMVFIPGGTFKFYGIVPGRTLPVKAEERWVTVPPYCIDQHEVDSWDYRTCISRKECEETTDYADQCRAGAKGCTNYRQAETYCTKGTLGVEKRLPFDEELMFAAKGTTNRKYPWGDAEQPPNKSGGTNTICIYPRELNSYMECQVHVTRWDLSPFGVWGLATNGDEWTASLTCISQPNHCVPAVIVRGCAWPNAMDQYTYPESAPDTPAYGGHLGPWLKFRCALSEF